MMPDADFNAHRLVHSLLRRSRQGALATLEVGSGDPYCSLVNVANAPDGAPILLISRLALHTRNILADPRISLMLHDHGANDLLEGTRIMVGGVAETATGEIAALLRRRYLAAHPSAEAFEKFNDFSFFGVRIKTIHMVAGFGRIVDLSPPDVLSNLSGADALLEAEPDILHHLNTDHKEILNLYATHILSGEPGDWRCTGCDPDGLDLQAGLNTLRLDFPRRIVTPAEFRQILQELADQAHAV